MNLAEVLLAMAAACGTWQAATPDPGVRDPAQEVPAEGDQRRSESFQRFDAPAPDPAELRARPEAFADLLESNGILLDFDDGSVSARGGTLHDRESLGYPIEYLVVTERGKTHEAAFMVKARPSVLEACLRAVSLDAGRGTRYVRKEPPPSQDELVADPLAGWEVFPAEGPLVGITVSWRDDDGQPLEGSLESMILDVRTGQPLEGLGWVHVGSTVGPIRQGREIVQRYMADIEGNVVAIYLDGRGTSLFERNSLDGIDDTLYTLNGASMPDRNTPVTLTFRSLGRGLPGAGDPGKEPSGG